MISYPGNLCLLITLLAPIAMQGSEHWVFIERETSGLEELALKKNVEIQKDDAHAGRSEKQGSLDLSKVTTVVGELKSVEKQEEKASEERKSQMYRKAKMIASPEDFESLWEDDIYERENRELSSETDSQAAEEKEEQKDKVEVIAVACTEPQRPSDLFKRPTEKRTEPEGIEAEETERCTSSWPEAFKDENKTVLQDKRTVLPNLDKEVLKTSSDSEALKTKVKLSDKVVSSATERIIYLGSAETDEKDDKTKNGSGKEELSSDEVRQEAQAELCDETGKSTRFASAVDSEEAERNKMFQSIPSINYERIPETGKPVTESDKQKTDTEDKKKIHIDQCVSEKEHSSDREDGDSSELTDYDTKDYRESSVFSTTEESSERASHLALEEVKPILLMNEETTHLFYEEEQSADETHSIEKEPGKQSDKKEVYTTTDKVDMLCGISETKMRKTKLQEIETSQICLQTEATEITKSTFGSSSEQLSSTIETSEKDQSKPQQKTEWADKDETLDSWQPLYDGFSEMHEPAENKTVLSEGSVKDKDPELEQSATDDTCELEDLAKSRLQELEDAANANCPEVEDVAKDRPSALGEESTKDEQATLDNISVLKETEKDESLKTEESSKDELHDLDRPVIHKLQELDKVEEAPENKTLEFQSTDGEQHCGVPRDDLQNSEGRTLDSEGLEQDTSSNLKQPSTDQLWSQSVFLDPTLLKLGEISKDEPSFKERDEVSSATFHAVSPERHKECSQTDKGRGDLQIANEKQKPHLEPLKFTICDPDITLPQKSKDITLPTDSHGGLLKEVSVASKIKMFEQGEICNPPAGVQHTTQKGIHESCSESLAPVEPSKMQIELQSGVFTDKSSGQVKAVLNTFDNKVKDPEEASEVIYLTVTQGTSEGEPSQPSSWKEDISIESEQEGDAELASPDSGCEITLAEAVVTPQMNCPTGKFIEHVV